MFSADKLIIVDMFVQSTHIHVGSSLEHILSRQYFTIGQYSVHFSCFNTFNKNVKQCLFL